MTAEQELTELLERCRSLAEDPEYPAVRRWLEANPGGKVLGHFQVYFPEEIAHAAGMFPLKISGPAVPSRFTRPTRVSLRSSAPSFAAPWSSPSPTG